MSRDPPVVQKCVADEQVARTQATRLHVDDVTNDLAARDSDRAWASEFGRRGRGRHGDRSERGHRHEQDSSHHPFSVPLFSWLSSTSQPSRPPPTHRPHEGTWSDKRREWRGVQMSRPSTPGERTVRAAPAEVASPPASSISDSSGTRLRVIRIAVNRSNV